MSTLTNQRMAGREFHDSIPLRLGGDNGEQDRRINHNVHPIFLHQFWTIVQYVGDESMRIDLIFSEGRFGPGEGAGEDEHPTDGDPQEPPKSLTESRLNIRHFGKCARLNNHST